MEALELCVSCKGCRRECPTGVDMARMKIEVAAEHKRRHGLTLRDRLVAHLPRYARWARATQPLASLALRVPGAGALVETLTGFDRRRPLPRFHDSWLSGAKDARTGGGRPIVLFADTFNNWFEPENLEAARKVLAATGHDVRLARAPDGRAPCCGRTYLTSGLVDAAREEARRTLAALAPALEEGVPIVGLEPSCVFTFRDEYPALLPGDERVKRLASVKMVDEYLMGEIAKGSFPAPWAKPAGPGPGPKRESRGLTLVHGHCHQKAFGTFEATLALLRTLPGAQVEAIESSCCGMAGSFGHEHYDVSMKMAELSLLPRVRGAPEALVAAAGTSCRQQIAHGAGRAAVHPLVLLAEAL
jgi:Fe-S oxidoreductase